MFAYFGAGFGADRVTDFQDGIDRIDFSRAAGVTFASLVITQVGADTRIALGGDTITLTGINAGNITAADFLFA
jgi:hypothetical protein